MTTSMVKVGAINVLHFIVAALNAMTAVNGVDVWIGLRRVNGFLWADESKVDYTNWAPGEPNNYDQVNI